VFSVTPDDRIPSRRRTPAAMMVPRPGVTRVGE
jgi:hypothetical protein